MSNVTDTDPTSSGWHSGIMSEVRLAAWMPAIRATAKTSPFFTSRLAIAMVVSGFMNTLQRAPARRWVGSFGVTSTMWAWLSGSRCVNCRSLTPPPYFAAWCSRSRVHRTGVDDLEARSGDRLQLVEIVVVPALARRTLEEPVRPVVGDDQAVALHRHRDHARLAGEPQRVERRLQPQPHAHRRQVDVVVIRREMGRRQHVATPRLGEGDSDRVLDLACRNLLVAYESRQYR